MPGIAPDGPELLRLLLKKYPRPGDADRAVGWPTGRTSTYKNRRTIPPKEWDKVRAVVGSVRPMHKGPEDMTTDDARQLWEFVRIVLKTPGFKDLLRNYNLPPEDQQVVNDVITGLEGDDEGRGE